MFKKMKSFTVKLTAGVNALVIMAMLLTGYSDRLSPADYPLLSCLGMVFPLFVLLNLVFLLVWIAVKWRMVWLPLVGFALAYVPINIYFPLNPSKEIPSGTLKVVSYNVCGYGGNFKYKDGFERILAYFEAQQADIVCTQEDYDTWRRYVMDSYQKVFPYNDTLRISKTRASINGVGIHTRFPIVRRERIEYESLANGSVAYYLKMGRDTLLVINNHLETTHLTAKDRTQYKQLISGEMGKDTMKEESKLLVSKLSMAAAKRASAAEAVRQYIAEHRQYPLIVCGDFNDTPISYARHVIADGLTDCFAKAGRGLGLSYNQKGFYFRIDHIFCSQQFEPVKCEIDNKIDFSDHYPLVCWLKIKDNY
jgi:endonuclease/exonuclease/phosphatase (EEP) superfamily protein YafD